MKDFSNSEDAYMACNCDDDMHRGKVFTVTSEKIVAISWAWPIAITEEFGELHSFKDDPRTSPRDWPKEVVDAVGKAIEIAKLKGFPLASWVKEDK